jgi:hypothetical protein
MAKIKLNGDTSGYIEISAPAVSGNNTLELGPGTKILTNLDNTFTGIATFSNGIHITSGQLNLAGNMQFTAATPELELNSGGPRFRVPAANTLTIHTGGGLGATINERLRIDSSGNIGINDSGPNFHLDVNGNVAIREGQVLTWHDGSGNKAGDVYMDSSDNFVIRNTSSVAERLRIDSAGRLMLGQNSAYSATGTGTMMLTVTKNATSRTDAAISNQNSGDNASAALVLATHGQDYILEATGSGNTTDGTRAFRILKGTDERLRIDSAGRMLLGTTTEGQVNADNLTVADSANCGITIRSGTSNSGNLYFSDATSGTAEFAGAVNYEHTENRMMFYTASTERIRITSAGDVGIGENSPADRLVVQKTNASGDVAARIKNDTTTDGSASTPTTASLYLTTSTGDFNTFYIQARRYDNDTHFGYSNPRDGGHTPNMIISNEGRITKPNQPRFFAWGGNSVNVNTTGYHTWTTFTNTRFNVGNDFSTSQKIFTAPVDGTYLFGCNCRIDAGDGGYFRIILSINNSTADNDQGHSIRKADTASGNYHSQEITALYQLSANDNVRVLVNSYSDSSWIMQSESQFWGYLVA